MFGGDPASRFSRIHEIQRNCGSWRQAPPIADLLRCPGRKFPDRVCDNSDHELSKWIPDHCYLGSQAVVERVRHIEHAARARTCEMFTEPACRIHAADQHRLSTREVHHIGPAHLIAKDDPSVAVITGIVEFHLSADN